LFVDIDDAKLKPLTNISRTLNVCCRLKYVCFRL